MLSIYDIDKYIEANIIAWCGSSNTIVSGSSFLGLICVLAITFCLVSAGIFKANTFLGMAVYATKSGGSSGGDKSGGWGVHISYN